jgi:outer membrane protein OmpA-like peptidoglycan-associated protein
VFFEWDSADITPDAASILDNAVSAYANCGSAKVMVAGYTDTSGKPRYNQGLSDRRGTSVKTYLASKGISEGAIEAKGFGETNLRVETADGVRELQNRRVEVTYGPGAGM